VILVGGAMNKLVIALFFILFFSGCSQNDKPSNLVSHKDSLVPGDENPPPRTDNERCLAFAELLLPNFDAKKYVLTDPLESGQKDTIGIAFNWSSSTDDQKQRVNCYFKKKNL
jgi:hypothetical protein